MGYADQVGSFGDDLGRQVTGLCLRDFQRRQQGGSTLGIQPDKPCDRLASGLGQAHRSTSPMIGSMLAMHATTSATVPPSVMRGNACRLANEGARSWTRTGRPVPSLTM